MKICLLLILAVLICFNACSATNTIKTMPEEDYIALRNACFGEPEQIDEVMKWLYDEMINRVGPMGMRAFIGVLGTESPEMDKSYLDTAAEYVLNKDLSRSYFDTGYSALDFGDCLSYGSNLETFAVLVDMTWHHVNDFATREKLAAQLERFAGWAYELTRPDLSGFDEDRGVWAYNNTNEDYPPHLLTYWHNGRIRMAGALGYAGCVLGNEDFIATAKYDLFTRPLPGGARGFLEFNTNNSGVYGEGMSYTEYTLSGLTKFFVARKRMTGGSDNMFLKEVVADLYENSLHRISPTMSHLTFDDTFETVIRADLPSRLPAKYSFSQAIPYFYQSGDQAQEARDHIKWFVNTYGKASSGAYAFYPSTSLLFSHNGERNLSNKASIPESIAGGIYSDGELTILRRPVDNYYDYINYPVLYVNHGNSAENTGHKHSDQSSFVLYYKGVQLLIDPGYRPAWHNYDLAKNWLASPFAHNVIMVNPHHGYYRTVDLPQAHSLLEEVALQHFWDSYNEEIHPGFEPWNARTRDLNFLYKQFEPVGGTRLGYNETEPLNPARRNFLITNDHITHLQIELKYDHPQEFYPDGADGTASLREDIIKLRRNFYALDLEKDYGYFIIYDEIESSDHNLTNEFMNQLHFAVYPHADNVEFPGQSDELVYSETDGIFSYTHFERDSEGNKRLFLQGIMGSSGGTPQYRVLDELPQGKYINRSDQLWNQDFKPPQWLHRSLRIKTSTLQDNKFLTILIPSDTDDYYPFLYAGNVPGGYGAGYITGNGDYVTHTAVSSDSLFFFPEPGLQFNSSAEFFLIEANDDLSEIRRFIMKGGHRFEAVDQGDRDLAAVVFESQDTCGEVLASYDLKNGSLHVIIKPEKPLPEEFFPQYKILRCGVKPENFTAQSYVLPDMENYSRNKGRDRYGYHDHIEILSYDDTYFYVNY